MKNAKVLMLSGLLVCAACSAYVLPVPADFNVGQTLPVSGASGFNQSSMTVGDYQVRISRGSTNEREQGTGAVSDQRKRQNYSFVVTRAGTTAFSGGCQLIASETSVAGPGGVSITARDNAQLDCEILPGGAGRESWQLELQGDPENPLNGTYVTAGGSYTLQGIGTAIGSTRHGPTGGYHMQRDGRTVAAVQTTGERRVQLSAGEPTDALVAAAVVLLLIDESVRDLD